MQPFRTALAVIGLAILLAMPCFGDTLIMKDGRRLEGRLGSQTKEKVTFFLKRGNVSTRMEFDRSDIAEIREGPIAEAPPPPAAPEPSSRAPALVALMNECCSASESAARRTSSRNISSAQAELLNNSPTRPQSVQSMIGRRVMVSGRVADVVRNGDTYHIQMQPIKSLASVRLTADDERAIATAQQRIDEARDQLEEFKRKRMEPDARLGPPDRHLDRTGWRLRMEANKKAIAQIKREAFERKPAHRVQVRTADTTAVSLRRGQGVQFEATVSSFEIGEHALGTTGAMEHFVICDLVAERIGTAETPPADEEEAVEM